MQVYLRDAATIIADGAFYGVSFIGESNFGGVSSGALDGQAGERLDPIMPSLFPDRYTGRRKTWIRESPDRDRDEARPFRGLPMNGRAANWTEAERDRIAAVGDSPEFARLAHNGGDLISREPSLDAVDAAGSSLALKAMADRDEPGFALARDFKLSANASCLPRRHVRLRFTLGRRASGWRLPPRER